MNKNLLEICLSPDLGGLELYAKNLTNYLNSFMVIGKKSKLEPFLVENSLKYTKIGRYSFFKLAKIIDENKIEIVHFHWSKDMPTVILAKLLSKQKPKIVQTRHMHMTRFKNDFYHKFLYKNIDTIVAVTKLVKEQIETFILKDISPKIEVCYIGANTPKILSKEEKTKLKASLGLNDEFVVTIVGRIEEAKGQHIVLEAVQTLKDKGVNAKTLVLGHTMNEEYLNKLKTTYKDDIFTGFVNNTSDLIQIADCLVLATKKETFGLVLIEAMKCGVCVLGSNSGGPLEIIDDEENGLLFESMNSNDLAEKLIDLYKNSQKKDALALKGQQKANLEFDSKIQFVKVKNILDSI